jgi:hypothetical protein
MVADNESQNARDLPADSSGTPAFSDSPDWLRSLSAEDGAQNNVNDASDAAPAAPVDDEPDWLRSLGGSQTQSAEPAAFSGTGSGTFDAAAGSSSAELPDWMRDLTSSESDAPKQEAVPTWLNEESSPASSADADLPAWLSGLPASEPAAPAAEELPPLSEDNAVFGDIPSWLKAAAPQSSIYSEQPEESTDWLNTFKTTDSPQAQPTPAFSTAEDEEVVSAPPAFTPDAQSSYNMDSLFTDMPEWLSSATENPNTSSPAYAEADASIEHGELPSWVQAMRPVDAGNPIAAFSSDQAPELRGALAGLQGVLPAAPGYGATSKPKAYSIKLQASEEQQAHAALLEQILAAETAPVPIASFSSLQPSNALRWAIAFVLFAILVPVIFLGTQFFALPVGIPGEINGALQLAQSIPEGAPVLVAFDYEPARAGEMETAAAPIFNLLRKPNLIFISTNETGGILAERFIAGPLAGFSANGGIAPLNLGYLPGGQIGIRAFAQNPPATAPFDVTLANAWASPQLQGITSLSQFAVLIIVTDNENSARAWIEQTSAVRGTTPILVVSSAQAAPMIQPYYNSQQVRGLVSGLYGGAVAEQNNGIYNGATRRYWDAYSVGMLLAAAFMAGGGLFNLALGLRDRVSAREAK